MEAAAQCRGFKRNKREEQVAIATLHIKVTNRYIPSLSSQENLNKKTEFNWAILTIGILQ